MLGFFVMGLVLDLTFHYPYSILYIIGSRIGLFDMQGVFE